jgi:hypothetical protein
VVLLFEVEVVFSIQRWILIWVDFGTLLVKVGAVDAEQTNSLRSLIETLSGSSGQNLARRSWLNSTTSEPWQRFFRASLVRTRVLGESKCFGVLTGTLQSISGWNLARRCCPNLIDEAYQNFYWSGRISNLTYWKLEWEASGASLVRTWVRDLNRRLCPNLVSRSQQVWCSNLVLRQIRACLVRTWSGDAVQVFPGDNLPNLAWSELVCIGVSRIDSSTLNLFGLPWMQSIDIKGNIGIHTWYQYWPWHLNIGNHSNIQRWYPTLHLGAA